MPPRVSKATNSAQRRSQKVVPALGYWANPQRASRPPLRRLQTPLRATAGSDPDPACDPDPGNRSFKGPALSLPFSIGPEKQRIGPKSQSLPRDRSRYVSYSAAGDLTCPGSPDHA